VDGGVELGRQQDFSVKTRRRAAFPGRRAGWVAGGGLGNTATPIVVPKFVGVTVRAPRDHGWEDGGEKSEWDEKTRNESHGEKKGM
jgi:hypothetical protein